MIHDSVEEIQGKVDPVSSPDLINDRIAQTVRGLVRRTNVSLFRASISAYIVVAESNLCRE